MILMKMLFVTLLQIVFVVFIAWYGIKKLFGIGED